MAKKTIEAFAIIQVPTEFPYSLTVVPMREKDVPDTSACSVYLKREVAERVLDKAKKSGKTQNIKIVPCQITYEE